MLTFHLALTTINMYLRVILEFKWLMERGKSMNYNTDKFLNMLYENERKKENLLNCDKKDLLSIAQKKRGELREVLNLEFFEEFEFEPNIKLTDTHGLEDNILEIYDVEFLPYLTSYVYVLKPNKPNKKSILYCHGHGGEGCKDSIDRTKETQYHKCIPLHMAQKGYTVVIPEFAGYGKMVDEGFKQPEQRGCIANSTILLLYDLNMAGLRVFEAMQMITVMQKLGLEDIAVYGVSGGGLVAAYLCALDERPKAELISSYTNLYKYSIMAMHHCIDNYPQGILKVGESPEIIALANPKPIFISGGNADRIFPVNGTEEAIENIKSIYEKFGDNNKIEYEIFEGQHEVSLAKVFEFLEKAL